jgi:choice-of-anchor A domain-containing protein/uncharacterized repeat protein (TIGR01451 family)
MLSSARRVAPAVLGALATCLAVLVPAATAGATAAPTCSTGNPLGAAQGYTEFVQGNGTRGSESEGAVAYGGNLNAGGMTVGTRLSVAQTYPSLVVNGTGNGNFNLQAGSAYVRSLNGNINFNGGGHRLADSPIDFTAAFADLRTRSAAWGAVAATGTADVVDSQTTGTALGGNVLWLRGTGAQLNVFHVTPAQLTNIRATFIDVPSGATALIDVSGTTVAINGEVRYRNGSTFSQADDSPVADAVSRTIWNLPDATSVTLNTGSAFGGTILAPSAAVTAQNVGHNNGAVIAASFSSNFETHQYLFPTSGCVPPIDDTPTPPTPPVTPTGTPELHVSKTVDHATVSPGGQATFTLTVTNSGNADAKDVVVDDLVPVGLAVTSADGGCTVAGQNVHCAVGTLAAGATKSFHVVTTAQSVTTPTGGDDQLTITKVEQQISLPAGSVQTAQVTCDNGIASDASVSVDAVDQGTGTLADVEVQRLVTTADGSGYLATVANHASGQAQAKLFAVCLPRATTGGHALLAGDAVTKTVALTPGAHTVAFDCGTGRTPIAPSLDVTSGRAHVSASVPVGASGRELTLQVDQAASVTVGVRCLSNLTGVAHGTTTQLVFTSLQKDVTVAPGATTTEQLICADDAKGVVAGWKLDGGIVPLGNQPQPKTRVFRLSNPTSTTLHGTVYLLCLAARTGSPSGVSDLTNTATASSSTAQTSGAVLSASAGVRIQGGGSADVPPAVTVDPPHTTVTPSAARAPLATVRSAVVRTGSVRVALACSGTCKGTVELRLAKRVRVAGHTYRAGTRVGTASFSRHGKGAKTVAVTVARKLAKVLRHKQLTVVVRTGTDARSATVLTRS